MSGSYFKEHLYYETKRDNSAGSYNGNISQQDIQYRAGGYSNLVSLQFDHTYDQLNRLTNSSIENDFSRFGEALSYDKHGNITSLARGGITVHNWVGGSAPTPNHTFYDVDQLIYYYNGNQVKSISDNSSGAIYSGAQDFKDNASTMDEYGYDANGNQTKDLNKKIVTVRYNSLNLPDTIQFQSGHMVSYVYDPMGQKESVTRKVVVTSGISIPVGKTLSTAGIAYTSTTSLIKYASNVVYGGSSGTTITDILLPDGLLKPFSTGSLTFTYNYYIRDHLGNVRAVIDGAGTIKQANNYNPFGMEYGESAESQTLTNYQNYQYSGKEFDRKLELNLYDFGARFYDATRGQWTTPDPLAALNYAVSPYVYCSNNPLNRIDPTGMVDEEPVYGGQIPEPNVKGTNTGNSGAFDSGANTSFFNSSINNFIDLYALSESQKTSFLAYTNGADGRARESGARSSTNVVPLASEEVKLSTTIGSQNLSMSLYRSVINKGNSPITIVRNANDLKSYEEIKVSNKMMILTLAKNGSMLIGKGPLSIGGNPLTNTLTLDLSIPTGRSSSLGFTLDYNPTPLLNAMLQVSEGLNIITRNGTAASFLFFPLLPGGLIIP